MKRILMGVIGVVCASSVQAAKLTSQTMRANVVLIEATSVSSEGDTVTALGAGLIVAARGGTYFIVTADHVARDESRNPRSLRVRYAQDPTALYGATADPRGHDVNLDVAILRAS